MVNIARTNFPGCVIIIRVLEGQPIQISRNEGVQIAREEKCSEYVQVDSDLNLTPEFLARLLSHENALVVCALYPHRSLSTLWLVTAKQPPCKQEPDGLMEVKQSAVGCSKIRMEVFAKLQTDNPDRVGILTNRAGEAKPIWDFFGFELVGLNTPSSRLESIKALLEKRVDCRVPDDDQGLLTDIYNVAFTTYLADNLHVSEDYNFCFPKDTMVYGSMKFVDMHTPGDVVLSHKGRPRKVLAISKRKFSGELIEFIPYFGCDFKCTPNHKVLVFRDGVESFVEAKEISNNDWLIVRKPKTEKSGSLVSPSARNKHISKNESGFRYTRTHKSSPFFPFDIPVTEEMARLAAYWCSEGCAPPGFITMTFHGNEKEYVKDVMGLLKGIFGLNSSFRIKNKTCRIQCNSVALRDFFVSNFGRYSSGRKIPKEILDAPIPVCKEFLIGYWRGDGYKKRDLNVATTSIDMAHGIRFLMLKCGIYSGIKKYGKKLVITPTSIFREKWAEMLGSKDFRAVRTNMPIRIIEFRDSFHVSIRAITKSSFSGDVFNLKVDKEETYNVNGFSVHNCRLCAASGIPIKVDTGLIVTHETTFQAPIPTQQLQDLLQEPWRQHEISTNSWTKN